MGERMTRTQLLWTLHKGERQISCAVTELEDGDVELILTQSNATRRSVHLHRLRDEATAEAQRWARNYVALGWVIRGDARYE